MTSPFLTFPDRAALVARLAEDCRAAIAEALDARGNIAAALSGGSTPAPLYRALAQTDLDWPRVTLALVDERWVPPDHDSSNERLVRETFAGPIGQGAKVAPMKTEEPDPQLALGLIEALYRPLRPLALVVLGMGPDGHTASWFPYSMGLVDALEPAPGATVAAVRATGSPVAGAFPDRATLTLPAVAEAGRIVLMLTGGDKRKTYERALEPGPVADMPVRALLRDAGAPLTVYWAP